MPERELAKASENFADALEHAAERLLRRDAQSITFSWLACANTQVAIFGDASSRWKKQRRFA